MKLFDRPWSVLGLYALATLVFTWPLAIRLCTHIPLGNGDIWSNLWNFWWWKTALFELGQSPYTTHHLFFPDGVSLAHHTHSPLNMLATLPINLGLGIEAAMNTALLAGFWLGGFGAWLLVRDLTGDGRAAFVAGFVFAFSPNHFEQSLEHLNLASIQFIPLFFFFLRRTLLVGGRANVLGTGLSFAANALVSWPHALTATLAGLAYVGREWFAAGSSPDRGRRIRELGIAAVVAFLLVLPFAWPMLAAAWGRGATPPKPFLTLGTDPLFWLVPSDHNPLLGWITVGFHSAYRAYHNVGFLTFVGFVPLGLSIVAVSSKRFGGNRRLFWAFWVAVCFVLSLGPSLTLLGKLHRDIPMPLAILERIPVLNALHVGNRFVPFAMLGIAVLVGLCLSRLFADGRTRLAWGLSAFIAIEFAWLPYPTQPIETHPYLEEIAQAGGEGAVLPLPLPVGPLYARALYDQTRHGRPIPGGYVSFPPKRALQNLARNGFLALAAGRNPAALPLDREQLADLGIEWVLVHKDRSRAWYRERRREQTDYYARRAWQPSRAQADETFDRVLAVVREKLGQPEFEDEALVVFSVSPNP